MRIWDGTEQLLYDASRERELMDILGIQSMDEVTIIPWRPPERRLPSSNLRRRMGHLPPPSDPGLGLSHQHTKRVKEGLSEWTGP